MSKGTIIVIDGLDGSGKATQSALLLDRLQKEGVFPLLPLTFPDYGSKSSELVKLYLSGELGSAGEVNAYAAASFYACDRFISYQQHWQGALEAGATIICDRYVSSNLIHQMVKLPREEWDEFIHWLEDYEYGRLGLPKPDAVIYLDVEPETSYRLISSRYHGKEEKRDIHEQDFDYLLHCRTAALYATEKLGWHRVQCCRGGQILPVEEIAEQIWAIYNIIKKR